MPFCNNSGVLNFTCLKPFKLRSPLFSCLLIVPFFLIGQTSFQKGIIIDSVTILNSENESYALYLPASFEETELSSIVFVFDPAARGAIGVAPFTEAAESYGHIVICSNDSKNGSYNLNFEIANRLFDAVFKKFRIKEDEMYVAGFSGGARLASAIASLTNKFRGVLACGAGFSPNPSQNPSNQNYLYAALCGNEDMNYREMLNNKGFLERLGFKNTLFTYKGGHSWPPKNQINRAFRWLFAQTGDKKNVLLNVLNISEEETKVFEASGEVLFAAENYERTIQSFGGVLDVETIKANRDTLFLSKKYKIAHKEFISAIKKEEEIASKLHTRFYRDIMNPDGANLVWWEKEFKKLKKTQETGPEQTRKMISRVSFSIVAEAYSRTNQSLYSSNEPQINFGKKIISIFNKNFN